MIRDPLADFVTRIRNASSAHNTLVVIPHSKFKLALAEKLEKEGYIGAVSKKGKKINKQIELVLKYEEDIPRIEGIERISRLSKRIYFKAHNVRPVKFGHGTMILTTPKGILTDREARKEKVGGEPILKIW